MGQARNEDQGVRDFPFGALFLPSGGIKLWERQNLAEGQRRRRKANSKSWN